MICCSAELCCLTIQSHLKIIQSHMCLSALACNSSLTWFQWRPFLCTDLITQSLSFSFPYLAIRVSSPCLSLFLTYTHTSILCTAASAVSLTQGRHSWFIPWVFGAVPALFPDMHICITINHSPKVTLGKQWGFGSWPLSFFLDSYRFQLK